ncbi:ROK family transcriptional regulator [Pseudonocardia eucalypti]|uniref:ROK family transcriptional regulator n=1 Tax=Pseudonocardia eucalypti TaxID=648755 RepID=A0ABP9PGJ5_9PSEU
MKEANQARLVDALRDAGTMTQAELARFTGLAPSTISNIVRALTSGGLLEVSPTVSRGRTAQAVRLSRSAGLLLAADFGHRHLTVAVADLAYRILGRRRVALEWDHRVDDGLSEVDRLAGELLTELGVDRSALVGVGMGLPAPIDVRTGQVGAPSQLPGWIGVDAAELAGRRLGVSVRVDNDANLGALAEQRWGAGRGAEHLAYLKLSDGVGCGLVIAGRLFRGAIGTAGELGHATMNEFGALCRCGNRGCLETLVATPALLAELARVHEDELTSIGDVIRLARAGEVTARRVLDDAGQHIGVAVANLCNIFNPDRIVVGGELSQAEDLVLASMSRTLNRQGIPAAAQAAELVLAELGTESQLLGALLLAGEAAGPHLLATLPPVELDAG